MCGDTRIPRDTCAGHTIPGETRIPATPVTRKPAMVPLVLYLNQYIFVRKSYIDISM